MTDKILCLGQLHKHRDFRDAISSVPEFFHCKAHLVQRVEPVKAILSRRKRNLNQERQHQHLLGLFTLFILADQLFVKDSLMRRVLIEQIKVLFIDGGDIGVKNHACGA